MQHVLCHMVQMDKSGILAFISGLLLWLKPLSSERGEETGVSRKKSLTMSSRKCLILNLENLSTDCTPVVVVAGNFLENTLTPPVAPD